MCLKIKSDRLDSTWCNDAPPHRRRSLLDFRGQQLLIWHIDHQNI
ncbi:hypothetical protein [Anabaena sp. UHCC 0399]|nr:hypothetical protein [Anabaena sp. UHCC 0399]MEA5565854.1 hypothetical protein [Anabaena sp. UHCC 0399]